MLRTILVALTAACLVPLTATMATAGAETDRLNPGEQLNPGERLVSPNGQYVLVMQGDGNLVEYAPGNRPVWATGTNQAGSIVRMQGDGNLVVIAPGNVAVWATGTSGNANADVELQSDGNIVVYAPGHLARWASGTPGGTSSLGDRITTVARNEAANGTRDHESPAGSDCNYYTAAIGAGSACSNGWRARAWCADFARYVWSNAGASVAGIDGLAASFRTGYGAWYPGWQLAGVQPGDAVVFNQDTTGTSDDHVGIVTAVAAGSVTMISGNYSNGVGTATVQRISGTQLKTLRVSGYTRPRG